MNSVNSYRNDIELNGRLQPKENRECERKVNKMKEPTEISSSVATIPRLY